MSSRAGGSRVRARRGPLAVAALAVLLVGGVVAPAVGVSDPTGGGLWYFTSPGVATAQETTTGKGITVAVIDGPVNPGAPDLVGANLITHPDALCTGPGGVPAVGVSTAEVAEHGTAMVSLILGTGAGAGGQPGVRGVAPGATVRHYASLVADRMDCRGPDGLTTGVAIAIDLAMADGAKIISMSQSGVSRPDDAAAIARAERAGVIVVAASKQDGSRDLGWPASGNGVVSVESADVNKQLEPKAVTSSLLAVVAPGEKIRAPAWADGRWDGYRIASGTSSATAWTSGVLALVWSAHPSATSNQVIQSLLRNTGTGHGGLSRTDSWGYGPVSLLNMLKVDPGTYPDVNPLLRDTPDAEPAYADVLGTSTPAPSSPASISHAPAASAQPGVATTAAGGTTLWWVLTGAGLGAVALVVVVVAWRRRRHAESTAT